MFSNTANNSANDRVNTRPRLKAYFSFIKQNQQKTALIAGYIITAVVFFFLGKTTQNTTPPKIDNQQQTVLPAQIDNTATAPSAQSAQSLNCEGKIKGASSRIYHVPGGSFYNRTTHPIACFDSEAEAVAAGFRKSQR